MTTTIEELVNFINNSGDIDKGWDCKTWRVKLTEYCTDWPILVADANNASRLEYVSSKDKDEYELCITLIDQVDQKNPKLAELWLQPGFDGRRRSAEFWYGFCLNHNLWSRLNKSQQSLLLTSDDSNILNIVKNLDVKTWQSFNNDMKGVLLHQLAMLQCRSLLSYFFSDDCFYDDLFKMIEHKDHRSYCTKTRFVEQIISSEDDDFVYQFKNLLYVLKETSDYRNLALLNSIMAEKHKTLSWVKKLPLTMNRLGMGYCDEFEIVGELFKILNEFNFSRQAIPSITLSFDSPPLFFRRPTLEKQAFKQFDEEQHEEIVEFIDIEDILGAYRSSDQQIILYTRGINWLCQKEGYDKDWLTMVVLIHELGHWVSHQLTRPDKSPWTVDAYNKADTNMHEGWAQLITYWVANNIRGEFHYYFYRLNLRQSPPYKIYEKYRDINKKKMLESLEKLRELKCPATVAEWNKILNIS